MYLQCAVDQMSTKQLLKQFPHQNVCIREMFAPGFFIRPCCRQPEGFKSRKDKMSQIISIWAQLCLGEFMSRRNRFKVNKRRKQPYIQYLVTIVDFDLLFIKVSSGKSGHFFLLITNVEKTRVYIKILDCSEAKHPIQVITKYHYILRLSWTNCLMLISNIHVPQF